MKPDFEIKKVKCYNVDCMEFMKDVPDNYYELAIVDPPYGIEITKSGRLKRYNGNNANWDNNVPDKEYFIELMRISKHQIIWGGNYFLDYLGNTKCFLIWDKRQPDGLSFASAEFAWTNFNTVAKTFRKFPVGIDGGNRIHTTQKPVILYKWILDKYAKCKRCGGLGYVDVPTLKLDCDVSTCPVCKGKKAKIIDTHGGSMSLGCACMDMDFDIDIMEIDKEYFDNAVNRLKNNVQEYLEF